jgi:hypothetical protein
MADSDVQTRLYKLTNSGKIRPFKARQVETVYWYCKLSVSVTSDDLGELELRKQVAKNMGIRSPITVFNSLEAICTKLEIADLRYVPDEYCQILVSHIERHLASVPRSVYIDIEDESLGTEILYVPDFEKLVWRPPSDDSPPDDAEPINPIEAVLVDQAGRTEQSESAGNQQATEDRESRIVAPTPTRVPSWPMVLVPALILLGLVAWGLSRLLGTQDVEVPLLQIATIEAMVDEQVRMTAAAMEPIVIDNEVTRVITVQPPTAEIIEQTRIVELVATVPVIQTQIVERTVVAEVPVTVEVTPEPTPTATVTPVPQVVDINEDFSDFTLDPIFEVEGEPQFAEGRMNIPSTVTLSLGDDTWKNYSFSFSLDSLGFGQSFGMTVRDNPTSKYAYRQHDPRWWEGSWAYADGGDLIGLVDTTVAWQGSIDVVVEDGFIYHTGPDGVTKTIPNTHSENGGFSLTFGKVWVDDLKVTRND